jgi:tetratricopeptide (TPR) repeat protein
VLRRCNHNEESLEYFKKLLSIEPNLHATHLQIAHLGSQRGISKELKEQGQASLKKLLDDIFEDYTKIPLRISLAALTRLRSYKGLKKTISDDSRQVKNLANLIKLSSFEGFGQFFEAFVSFTSLFSYKHDLLCTELMESLPELLTIEPNAMHQSQWINTCGGLTNIIVSANREGKTELASKILPINKTFANKAFQKLKLNSYSNTVLAKTYLAIKEPKQALEVIGQIPTENQDHWVIFQKSKAFLELNQPDEAYNSASEALSLAENDPKAETYMASYHDLLSQCAEKKGNLDEAKNQVKLAIKTCNNSKYEELLERRLETLE